MKNLLILTAATLTFSTNFVHAAVTTSFCGELSQLSFREFSGRINAYAVILRPYSQQDKLPLHFNKIIVTDPKVVFKVAKVISQVSVQNPKQLQEDLKNSQFTWDSVVSDELHPNPYVEDFEACLRADLDRIGLNSTLERIDEIVDLREDGYSIIDLVK